MIIAATFAHSLHLELAITDLEKRGIPREHIGAVPMDKRPAEQKIFDSIHRADGISLFDGAAALAVVFGLLGAIYGFVLTWGPILWMVIGMVFGAILGFGLDIMVGKLKSRNHKTHEGKKEQPKDDGADVIVIINCEASQKELVERVFWDNSAIGVGILEDRERINK